MLANRQVSGLKRQPGSEHESVAEAGRFLRYRHIDEFPLKDESDLKEGIVPVEIPHFESTEDADVVGVLGPAGQLGVDGLILKWVVE